MADTIALAAQEVKLFPGTFLLYTRTNVAIPRQASMYAIRSRINVRVALQHPTIYGMLLVRKIEVFQALLFELFE